MKRNRYWQDTFVPWDSIHLICVRMLTGFLVTFAVMMGLFFSLRVVGMVVPRATLEERARGTQSEADMIQAHHDAIYGEEDGQ